MYLNRIRYVFLWSILSIGFISTSIYDLRGQSLGFYGGAGVGYDGFLRDKLVMNAKSGWPFRLGPQAIAGFRYHTRQNFDITLDATLGISGIEMPLRDKNNGKLVYQQIQTLIMAGSGLNISMNDDQNIMPFIQLGAGFFDFWDLVTVQQNGSSYSFPNDYKTNRWVAVCGAGIDWQFRLFLASGLNLRCTYTPLNLFRDPIPYSENSIGGSNDMLLQGKIVQFLLTYRVNLPITRWESDDDYRR